MNTWAKCYFFLKLMASLLWSLLPVAHALAAEPLPPLARFSAAADSQVPAPWRVVGLPKGKAPLAQIDIANVDGERVLRLATDKSYGTLTHVLPDLALPPQVTLHWKWRLDQALPRADLRRKDGDDVALKVCAMFDLPLEKLGWVERSLLALARTVSGEQLPAATLCYVWDQNLPPGTGLPNAYTRRVRFVVLNSGDVQLKQWVTHERKLSADFLKAFGSDTDTVPPLVAIVVGADSDNTGGASLGYIGDITMKN